MKGAESSLGLELAFLKQGTATQEGDIPSVRASTDWIELMFMAMEAHKVGIHTT